MKAHKTIMIVLAALAAIVLLFGPIFNVGRGYGVILLICPLMMLGMMFMMSKSHDGHEK